LELFYSRCVIFQRRGGKILEVPLSCTNQEDTLIWRSTKNGVFSVRSAYHLLKEKENNAVASLFELHFGEQNLEEVMGFARV
jgi:hypothetical protein